MFLPISKEDLIERNIEQLDFIIISGDAYVDHPSFGIAIISRLLEHYGFSVGIIAQPNINNNDDFRELGTPKLGFLVSSGNIDSMVNHYSVSKRRRTNFLLMTGLTLCNPGVFPLIKLLNVLGSLFLEISITRSPLDRSVLLRLLSRSSTILTILLRLLTCILLMDK